MLLAPHGAGLALVGVPETGFLDYRTAVFNDLPVALSLIFDRFFDVLERVHVLDLGPRAVLGGTDGTDRDVGIAAQAPLFHVAVRDAEVLNDLPELLEIGRSFLRRADVRIAHDFEKRHAAAVQVDVGIVADIVDRLARILLDVDPDEADLPASLAGIDMDRAFTADRLLVLRDLVAFGQVGIKIVLPGQHRMGRNGAPECKAELDGILHDPPVEDRKGARQRKADRAYIVVRRPAELSGTAAECLAFSAELTVDLEAHH